MKKVEKKKIYHDFNCWAVLIEENKTIHACDCSQKEIYQKHFPEVIDLKKY